MSKTIYVLSSSIALGIGAYAAYRYWKKRDSKCIDEGFEDVPKLEENPERILVLGLQSSGKTTLVSQITTGLLNTSEIRPTEGFNVTNLNHGHKVINIWDGGSENVRRFWSNFIQDTDVLVFVVDASDTHNIVIASKELKNLAGDERLKNVPIIVVASKQDIIGALNPEQVADALDVKSISPSKHKIKILGCRFDSNKVHPSVLQVKKAILDMI